MWLWSSPVPASDQILRGWAEGRGQGLHGLRQVPLGRCVSSAVCQVTWVKTVVTMHTSPELCG